MSNESILEQLLAGGNRIEICWKKFLRQHSRLLLKIIWQHEKDHDEVMEKYLFVCSRLAANNFGILRKYVGFQSDPQPGFINWLAAVVRNLCIDAHRSEHGRKRFPKALMRFTETDRLVFKLYYWRGMSLHEIDRELHARSNGSAPVSVAQCLERIQQSLARMPDPPHTSPVVVSYDTLPHEMPGDMNDSSEDHGELLIEDWLKELTSQERLVVRMRFWEDMTAKQISAITRIQPEHRVYTILNRALQVLRKRAAAELDL